MTSFGCAGKLVTGPESRSLVPIEVDTGCRITGTLNTGPESRSPVLIDGNNAMEESRHRRERRMAFRRRLSMGRRGCIQTVGMTKCSVRLVLVSKD